MESNFDSCGVIFGVEHVFMKILIWLGSWAPANIPFSGYAKKMHRRGMVVRLGEPVNVLFRNYSDIIAYEIHI